MENAWFLVSVLFFGIRLIPIDGFKHRNHPVHSENMQKVFSITTPPSTNRRVYDYSNDIMTSPTTKKYTFEKGRLIDDIDLPFELIHDICYYCHTSCPKSCIQRIENCYNTNMVLNLSSTGMRTVDETFIHSPYLKILYLNDNNITKVSSMAFHGLTRLEYLSLSNNNICTEKLLYLKGHGTLKTLVLDDNKYNLSDGTVQQVLDSMLSLNELSLKRDEIKEFNVKLKEFAPHLTKLYLSGNKITSLDFLNNVPEGLSHLHLDNNSISHFSANNLSNLQVLSVTGNKIEELCAKESCVKGEKKRLTLVGMTSLMNLNASSNEISNVAADAFTNTKRLVHLDLSNNKITELPDKVFEGLTLLETLRVNKNQLVLLPNSCSLNRLTSLDLSDNNIVHVTRSSLCIDHQRFLKWLDLSGNQIVNFPLDLFDKPNYLKVLLLKDNNIGNINALLHKRMWEFHLEELHLEGNPLLHFNVNTMPNLKIHVQRVKKKTEVESVTTTTEASSENYFS